MTDEEHSHSAGNSPRRVLFASLIGTTIEFFDFYIYATAAVLVFPQLLATENAPPGKRAWYGMFPQLGAPIGFYARPESSCC